MASSTYLSLTKPIFTHPTTTSTTSENSKRTSVKILNIFSITKTTSALTSNFQSGNQCSSQALGYSIPLAASVAVLLWSNPVNAGILSGSTGLESIPGPQLPQIDFLNKFNDENQKKYAEFDERIKTSPLLKEYLERSKLNKEKNKQSILDKYCIRGAEWGVGDCSAEGMTQAEKDSFVATLKKKAGVE